MQQDRNAYNRHVMHNNVVRFSCSLRASPLPAK